MITVPVLPISDARHCNRSRSALQPSLQCTASFPANVCIRHRKRLHPGLQTLSSVLANVITEKTPSFKNLFPCFSTEPAPSKVCAPEAQRPGEGRTTPYIYIMGERGSAEIARGAVIYAGHSDDRNGDIELLSYMSLQVHQDSRNFTSTAERTMYHTMMAAKAL